MNGSSSQTKNENSSSEARISGQKANRQLTCDTQRTRLRLPNNVGPEGSKKGDSNESTGRRDHRNAEKRKRESKVVQKKELDIMLQTSHKKRRRFFDVKWAFFSDSEDKCDAAKFPTIKEAFTGSR